MIEENTNESKSPSADKPTLTIIFDQYISDEPGFAGKLEFIINGKQLIQNRCGHF